MKNRKLLLIVSLVLALTMSLGGTLAYLTDSDGDVNVMTVGRVEIKQNEQDRDGNGFEQEQQLLPIVTPAGTKDEVYKMYPADPNYIDKIVTVTNSGNTDAWVRTLIAIPEFTYEDKPVNNANGEVLHWNGYSEGDKAPSFPAAERLPGTDIDVENHWWWGKETASAWPNNGGEWNSYSGVKLFEDSDLTYTVMFVTHTTKLGAKETTAPNLLGIYLDSNVDYDNDNGYYTMNQKKIEGLTGDVKIPVLSQAVQASGFDTAWEAFDEAFKLGDDPVATIIGWFGDMKQDTTGEGNVPPVFYTSDPAKLAELAKMLSENTDAMSGNVTIELTESYDMTGFDWKPISVDGYHGAGVITVEGNGNTIKGLKAPLFAGGFAGSSGIVIKNLTIADSNMTAPTSQGSGAFICCVDSMPNIELINCHAKNVTLNGKSRTGGLIGWTSGYSNVNDGPVKTYVTIDNCSVVGCTINAETESAGGLIGHSGASDWTYTTVTNCKVVDTEINGGSDRTGIYLGTSNVGETTFANCSNANVSGSLNEAHPEYGRTAHGETGKLVINGVEIK